MTLNLKPVDENVVAFMDLGTNSVRLLLVRLYPNHSYATLTQQKEVIRLGEGEFADQYLQPEAMDRAVLVCSKFAGLSRSYGAKEIVAVATSAVRDAKNRKDFLRRLRHEAGIDMRVISGREEARLIYLGIASAVHLGDKQAAFIDIGGGSTEIIAGDQQQYQFLGSLNLGAVRLTTMFFLPEETAAVLPERYALLQRFIRNASVRTLQEMKKHRIDHAFGSSGTVENLTDIAARALHNRPRQRDDTLTHDDLKQVIDMLCARTLEERRNIPGINPERADIIIAGAAILDTLMQDLKIKQVRVISEHGLREGMLVDYLSRGEHAELFKGTSVRERSVLQLGRACGFDEAHARHIAQLALEMFDSSKKIGLHALGDRERELLEYSALLHDIGSFLSYNNHHLHTSYLIRNAELLGFDEAEISMMAVTSLFHRKGMPTKKNEEYAALDKPSRQTVRMLSTFLRIAEGLDRSHNGVITHAKLRALDKTKVRLEVQAKGDCQLELWGVEDRLKAFEKVFDREVEVKLKDSSERKK
ncbi:MAG: Ppx/GppA family phosphatase [Chloroflexi bacterium]|nr:Ppx/GppA family phosphatase [Chloroflexota bacterium]